MVRSTPTVKCHSSVVGVQRTLCDVGARPRAECAEAVSPERAFTRGCSGVLSYGEDTRAQSQGETRVQKPISVVLLRIFEKEYPPQCC